MSGRIAIDFGTAKTVVASWDHVRQQGFSVPIAEIGRSVLCNDEQVNVIPSFIHYGTSDQQCYGNQVLERNLVHSGRSFQWMKQFICTHSLAQRKIDEKLISDKTAAEALLAKIIAAVKADFDLENEEVAITLPVEAFEYYENWLSSVARQAGLSKVSFIDEPSAAALGYSTRLFPDEICLVVDFGASALGISIVRQELLSDGTSAHRCRVLGKAGTPLGGNVITEWLYRDIVHLNGYTETDLDILQISRLLLAECEALKERLSSLESSALTVMNPHTGHVISSSYSRIQLEALIERNGGYSAIDYTMQRALDEAREKGFNKDRIKVVLMVGGSCLIPSVQNRIKEMFGKEKVKLDRPLDAIARGAAAFIAGETFDDHIQHDYALRFLNSATQEHEYRTLVKRGSNYPSAGMLATMTVKAVSEGQSEFMMQIFEVGKNGHSKELIEELSFDEEGNVRFALVDEKELERRNTFWVNEENRSILRAEPPAAKGEECFEVSFAIDGNRRLLVTAKDLKSGILVHQNIPVVELS